MASRKGPTISRLRLSQYTNEQTLLGRWFCMSYDSVNFTEIKEDLEVIAEKVDSLLELT